jgi:hypothetical protein
MANVPISKLPALPTDTVISTDLFPVSRGNTTYKATGDSFQQYPSFRNKIINGDMRIDQRNAGAVATVAPGTNVYTLDRWYGVSEGGTIAHQKISVSGVPRMNTGLRVFGGTTNTWVAQRIESSTAVSLAGLKATLSFYASSNELSQLTVGWGVPNNATPDNWASGGTRINQTVSITNTLTRYTITFNVPSEAVRGLYISFYSQGPLSTGKVLDITGVQLEEGSIATPFEYRPIQTELALCQRYYEKSYNIDTKPGTITNNYGPDFGLIVGYTGGVAGTVPLYVSSRFRVTKRIVPTVITYSGAAGTPNTVFLQQTNGGVTTNYTTNVANKINPYENGFSLAGYPSSFTTPSMPNGLQYAYGYYYTADAEL